LEEQQTYAQIKLIEEAYMLSVSWVTAAILFNFFMHASAGAQTLEVKRYNYAEWTKGRFTEVVTVTGPGKMIFLAGVGAEDEDKPQGTIRHLGNPYLQCKYAYDKMKRHLAKHGGTLADVVKQVVYVTDIRYQADVGKCRREEYGENGPIPAHTFLVISGLAIPGMLLEIDITAVVPQ
jgi:2-iminobutanoate/2-iminopropanoate deaminase